MIALDGSAYYLEHPYASVSIGWDGINSYYDVPEVSIASASYYFGVKSEYVFSYSGLTDVIYLFFSIIPAKKVYLLKREFPIYKYVLNNLGIPFQELGNDISPFAIIDGLKLPPEEGTIFVISRPNSIFGSSIELDLVEKLIGNNPHVLFIVDEAYQTFSTKKSALEIIEKYENFVCLKTASKEFFAPSLRLAWLFSSNRDLLGVFFNRTYNTVSHLSEILIENVIMKQRRKHTQNIVYIINERDRLERSIVSGLVKIHTGSETCMILVSMEPSIYPKFKEKFLARDLEPLFLNDLDVFNKLILPNAKDCFARINVWSKQVNDNIIEIINNLQ